MYCPNCHQENHVLASACRQCGAEIEKCRDLVYVGRQFVFVSADEANPVALRVDGEVRTLHARTIFSRHQHVIGIGDEAVTREEIARLRQEVSELSRSGWIAKIHDHDSRKLEQRDKLQEQLIKLDRAPIISELAKLSPPAMHLTAAVTDRKIYRPGDDATIFIVAPAAAGQDAAIEIRLADQKVYEARARLNGDGLTLHRYADVREGEYSVHVTFADHPEAEARCTFGVAEFSLSPLIAILEKYQVHARKQRLTFALKILLLSRPYTGPAELRLHCPACARRSPRSGPSGPRALPRPRWDMDDGGRVSGPLAVEVRDGEVTGKFGLCNHDGPFRIEVVTPQGHTAQVALPNLGAAEREQIPVNTLGQMAEAGLAPWQGADPIRGMYVGAGAAATTPLALESVHADVGRLQALADIAQAQVVAFDPQGGGVRVIEAGPVARGGFVDFDAAAPYTLFTVGAFFKRGAPFEGWGAVIKPVPFTATLDAPATAAPGAEIGISLEVRESDARAGHGLYCWLLVYDARLEHESPMPKLGKRIYESIKEASGWLASGKAPRISEASPYDFTDEFPMTRGAGRAMFSPGAMPKSVVYPAKAVEDAAPAYAGEETAIEIPELVLSPARMEFPELVYNELFYVEGVSGRTVKLGDQIGAWRVRAYLFRGADYRELTADVQAEKPLYAELDLPAIASDGDEIFASVQYQSAGPADLLIATPYGQTEARVEGHGSQRFAVRGPGRVEVHLRGEAGADWAVRDVAAPGRQRVTASRLMILRQDETVKAERVVVYAAMGHVLADTITALIGYPFG